jgi:hypothetical protein
MLSKALLISSLISVAFATVYVTAPVASTTYQAGQSAVVSWIDDNNAPTLAQFGLASISIYVGNAKQQTSLQVLNPSVDVSKVSSINFIPDASIGPNGQEYFIRFQSLSLKDSSGNPAESFSALFSLSGMKGAFASSVLLEIAGQSTAPFANQSPSGSASGSGSSSTPSVTGSSAGTGSSSSTPTGTSSHTSATAKTSSPAMGLKAGWVGIVFGAAVGVTIF